MVDTKLWEERLFRYSFSIDLSTLTRHPSAFNLTSAMKRSRTELSHQHTWSSSLQQPHTSISPNRNPLPNTFLTKAVPRFTSALPAFSHEQEPFYSQQNHPLHLNPQLAIKHNNLFNHSQHTLLQSPEKQYTPFISNIHFPSKTNRTFISSIHYSSIHHPRHLDISARPPHNAEQNRNYG
jgi:hypothetical protein